MTPDRKIPSDTRDPDGAPDTDALYVAARYPEPYIIFRWVWEGGSESIERYEEMRERVAASIREALDVLGVRVVEEDHA